jgi:hypothetical protein
MNLHPRNILGHFLSTLIGLIITLGAFLLVKFGHATFTEVSGLLVLIVPSLLFGVEEKKGGQNG